MPSTPPQHESPIIGLLGRSPTAAEPSEDPSQKTNGRESNTTLLQLTEPPQTTNEGRGNSSSRNRLEISELFWLKNTKQKKERDNPERSRPMSTANNVKKSRNLLWPVPNRVCTQYRTVSGPYTLTTSFQNHMDTKKILQKMPKLPKRYSFEIEILS